MIRNATDAQRRTYKKSYGLFFSKKFRKIINKNKL